MDIHKKYALSKAVIAIAVLWMVIIALNYSLSLFNEYIEAVRYEVLRGDYIYMVDKVEKTLYVYDADSLKFVLVK